MYLDPSFCHFEASTGTLHCMLPWSGQESRLHAWPAGCRFEIKGQNGWRDAPDEADLPILSDVFAGEETHPFSLYARGVPKAVAVTVSRYGTNRQAMLQVCAASERGRQLLYNSANLLWFVAPFVARASGGEQAAIHSFLGYKQNFLLTTLCGSPHQMASRLLRMLPVPSGLEEYRATLAHITADENCSLVFRHRTAIDWPLLFLAVRHRALFHYPVVRRLFLDAMPIGDLQKIINNINMIYRDTARAGRALGIADVPALIEACGTYDALINLHSRWTQRLNARSGRYNVPEPNDVFPTPPFPGTETIQPVLTVQDLRQEGAIMHHCVAGYTDAVHSGSTFIYRILKPERATVEVQLVSSGMWSLMQIKSFNNAAVGAQTRQAVLSWLREEQSSDYTADTMCTKEQPHAQKMEP